MKVLHLITGLDAGGAETQLAMVVARSSHDVDVVAMYNPGPLADRIRASGIRVIDLGMKSNRQVTKLLSLHRLIRKGRYDVVHTHLFRSQIYGRPAARLARTPVVLTTEHSIGETHIERREMTFGVRALYLASELFSDGTIAVSDVVEERLVKWGVPRRKITVVPNGVDVAQFRFDPLERRRVRAEFEIPEDAFVIGSLGRLDPNKRIDLLIEAAAPMLSASRLLFVVGRGEEMEHLQEVARTHGVADYVVFGGFQADTSAMLSAFDLFVTTSRQETFGLSVLEALASGLPTLFTVCPALDGITTERARQVTGELEPLRRELRKELEQGPRERIVPNEVFALYGIESVIDQIDDVYARLLSARPRRRRREVAGRAAASGSFDRPAGSVDEPHVPAGARVGEGG